MGNSIALVPFSLSKLRAKDGTHIKQPQSSQCLESNAKECSFFSSAKCILIISW